MLANHVQVAAKRLRLQQANPAEKSKSKLAMEKRMDTAAARALKRAGKTSRGSTKPATKRAVKASQKVRTTSSVVAAENASSGPNSAKDRPPPKSSRPKRTTNRPINYVEDLEDLDRLISLHVTQLLCTNFIIAFSGLPIKDLEPLLLLKLERHHPTMC